MSTIPRTTRAARSVRAAIDFMALDGRAERYLAVHHIDVPSGRCASCGAHFPCSVAYLARRAAEKAARTEAALQRAAADVCAPTVASTPQAADTPIDPPASAVRPYVDALSPRKAAS